jgi:predicted dehydrogenase
MAKRIGIGIIGCGAISRSHIDGYLTLPENAQMLAVCDVLEDRAQSRAKDIVEGAAKRSQEAKEYAEKTATTEEKEKLSARQAFYEEYQSGVKVFTDLHQMLKLPGLDAVSVCTPPFAHAPATLAAAKAGKHVYCEKPMAMNATEARAMCEACNQAGVKLGYQSGGTRLGAVNAAIRNYITSGKLGDVYYGRLTSFRVRGRPGVDMMLNSKWFIDSTKAGGGAVGPAPKGGPKARRCAICARARPGNALTYRNSSPIGSRRRSLARTRSSSVLCTRTCSRVRRSRLKRPAADRATSTGTVALSVP